MERRIDLNTNQRRAVVVLAVLGFLLVTGIIYLDKRAAYTAKLDQRTFNLALVGTIDSLAPAKEFYYFTPGRLAWFYCKSRHFVSVNDYGS
jgi:hypothetical protein